MRSKILSSWNNSNHIVDNTYENAQTTQTTAIINGIWKRLHRASDLIDTDAWPWQQIREITENTVPTVPKISKI